MTGTKLNIGCGVTHHPDWINLDVSSFDPSVLNVDITNGLPFSSDSVDACYSSHVLEHLDKNGARDMLAECFRVLKSGGVVRLAVPDLEGIAREYLRILDAVASGDRARDTEYDWIMLEMYDQTVRVCSGGEMAKFLIDMKDDGRAFVRSRIGAEADSTPREKPETDGKAWMNLFKGKGSTRRLLRLLREKLAGWMVFVIAGKAAFRSFNIGIFRDKGELHRWMFDRYSLKRLLEQVGFANVKICSATESRIPEFESYSLDALNGRARKPDSLFIEASKL